MTRQLNRFLTPDTFEEILSCIAILGMLIHSAVILLLFTFFPDIYTQRMGNYPLRGLDPLWWILWFLGIVVCAKSGMFKYQRRAWGVATGLFFSLVSLLPTLWWGLGYGMYLFVPSFMLIGICILLNRFHNKAAA